MGVYTKVCFAYIQVMRKLKTELEKLRTLKNKVMKKVLIVILLFIAHFSNAQEPQAKEFFNYLEKNIPKLESDSITLTIVQYDCLGGQFISSAKITNIGKLIKVDYYHQKPKDVNKPESEYEYETVLDTTFTVERNILKKNLHDEITGINSNRILVEASFQIILNQKSSNKEFKFRRGEGLYYLLRYNKSYESYNRRK
jgi:hypothetical protein